MKYKINVNKLKEYIKFNPHPGQDQVLKKQRRFTIICAGRRFGKCRDAESLLQLADGSIVTVKDLIGKKFNLIGVDKNGDFVKTKAIAEDNGIKKVYEIITASGRNVSVTGNHPFLTLFGWKTIDELKAGDRIAATEYLPIIGEEKLDINEIKIIAYLIGDGGVSQKTPIFSQQNNKILKEFKQCIEKRIGSGKVKHVSRVDYKINGLEIRSLIKKYGLSGKKSYDKEIPEQICRLNDRQLKIFISRLFATDGWFCKSKNRYEIGYCSVSKKLINQLQILLLRFNIKSKIYLMKTKSPFGHAYQLTIHSRDDINEFSRQIGIFSKMPRQKNYFKKTYRNKSRILLYSHKNWFYDEIKSIKYLGQRPTVAIQVPKYEVYADRFIEHNTILCAYLALRELWGAQKKVWIVSPNYELSKKVFDYLVFWVINFFPKGHFKVNYSQLTINCLSTGSFVMCKSAENPDSLIGDSLDLLIIDEAARVQEKIWQSFLRPCLTDRCGRAIFISCVTNDTFVLTKDGLKQVKTFPFKGKKQDYKTKLYGRDGFAETAYLWQNKSTETRKITIEGKYSLEGTLHHPVIARDTIYKKFGTWTELQDLTKNHFVLLQLNQQIFGNKDKLQNNFKRNNYNKKLIIPKKVNKDFAYLIGLLLGDGHVWDRGIIITNQDKEIKDFVRNKPFGLCFSEDKEEMRFKAGSDEFVSILDNLGYKKVKAKFKTIPENCLKWSKENICSLLSGLFDADGCCTIANNGKSRIIYASTSFKMIKQVQMLLLNLGIVSSFTKRITKPTKKVKVNSVVYNIEINDQRGVKRFKKQIGFRIKRKQDKIKYHLKKYQRQYIKKENCEFLWKRVTKIEKLKNKTYDFNIPVEHNFFSNGFISHNTPTGKNWFHRLWCRGQGDDEKNKNYISFQFKTIDNPTIPNLAEDIQEARESLAHTIFMTEYEASFEDGTTTVFRNISECVWGEEQKPIKNHLYAIGVDLGRYKDYTVICVIDRANHHLVKMDRFKILPWGLQKKRIKAIAEDYNDALVYIDSSIDGDCKLFWKENKILKYGTLKTLHQRYEEGKHIEVLSLIDKANPKMRTRSNTGYPSIKHADINWRPIKASINHGFQDVYEVELRNGKKVNATASHSFFKSRNFNSSLELAKIHDTDSLIGINKTIKGNSKKNISLDFITFLGLWIADGSFCRNTNVVNISTGNDKKIISFIKIINSSFKDYGKRGDYTICNKNFKADIIKYGIKNDWRSYNKRIPSWLFTASKNQIYAFLKGYFSGDGCTYIHRGFPVIQSSSVNYDLSADIQVLLSRIGIRSVVGNGKKNKLSPNLQYPLTIGWRKSVKEFKENIGFLNKNIANLDDSKGKTQKSTLQRISIRKIKYLGKKEVYDLNVPETESFVVENMLCHNTGVGDPIFEDLVDMNLSAEDYKFTNKSKRHLIDKLVIFIQQKKLTFPNIPVLINELETYAYTKTEKGNITYNAPAGFHDDVVISLALAIWDLPNEKPGNVKQTVFQRRGTDW